MSVMAAIFCAPIDHTNPAQRRLHDLRCSGSSIIYAGKATRSSTVSGKLTAGRKRKPDGGDGDDLLEPSGVEPFDGGDAPTL
jgi:hypothetical protein